MVSSEERVKEQTRPGLGLDHNFLDIADCCGHADASYEYSLPIALQNTSACVLVILLKSGYDFIDGNASC